MSSQSWKIAGELYDLVHKNFCSELLNNVQPELWLCQVVDTWILPSSGMFTISMNSFKCTY